MNGANVPPQFGVTAAAFACRPELGTQVPVNAVTPYLEHSLQFLEQLLLIKLAIEAATLYSYRTSLDGDKRAKWTYPFSSY